MTEFLARVWQDLIARPDGPLFARLLIQPTVAVIFGIRAGLKDGREGRGAYLWRITWDASSRPQALRQGWKDVGKLFVAALVLDLVYQWLELPGLLPGEAVVVAACLALIPYALVRSVTRRLAAARK